MIITCLIGDPVEHSISDYMFNYFGKRKKLDYSHVKFKISLKNKKNLKIAIQSLKILGIKGANITLPYKTEVIKHIDKIDKTAISVGAVNTIVNKNNILVGYNTDCYGAITALENCLRKIKPSDKIVVLGAGEAARVVIYELIKRTKNISILNRILDFYLAKRIKENFKRLSNKEIKILPLNNKNIIKEIIKSNFVINATPVGMFPKVKNTLVSRAQFHKINKYSSIKNKYFLDAVFNPYLTLFLSQAKSYGAKICPGIYWMVYQGEKAFKLWTGKNVGEKDLISVHNLLKKKLYHVL